MQELEAELKGIEQERLQDNESKRQIEDLLDFKRSLQEQDRVQAEIDQVSLDNLSRRELLKPHQDMLCSSP